MALTVKMVPRLAWAAVALGTATCVFGVLCIAVSLLPGSSRSAYWVMTSWARTVAKLIGLTFSVTGVEKVAPGVSYIVTPNHQGHTDILALLNTLPVRFRWVVKQELLKIPIFGWALARTGAIALDRSKGREAMDKLRQQKDKLQNGWGVLVYPEGTRTSDGQLQSFKRGAFVMAVHLDVPILPVTTNGAFKVLPRNTIEFRPGHITVTIDDPIQINDLSEDDIPELMEKTRNAILKNLDVDYNPFNSQRDH